VTIKGVDCISKLSSVDGNSVIFISEISIKLFISLVISFLSAATFHSRGKSWLIEAKVQSPPRVTCPLSHAWTADLALCFISSTFSLSILIWKGFSFILKSIDFNIGSSSEEQLSIATWLNTVHIDFAIFLTRLFCPAEVKLSNGFKTVVR